MRMKVNHLILGSSDVEKSAAFYCELFGFQKTSDDPGEVGGQVLHGEECDINILPFESNLPNPFHFAFEVNSLKRFESIMGKASELGLKPRSEPSRSSTYGPGEHKRNGRFFKNFYITDPSGTLIELMVFI
jgi:catechol 2,3-dioxygenase-like lactoylglutathione lyase family enzyme